MSHPVDPNKPNQPGAEGSSESEYYDDNWVNDNYDTGNKAPSKKQGTQSGYKTGGTQANYPNQGPNQPNPGTKNMGTGGVAKNGQIPGSPQSAKQQFIQKKLSEGYTPEQIKQMGSAYEFNITPEDITYAQKGVAGGTPYGYNKYMQYGNSPVYKSYGNNPYMQSYIEQQMYQESQQMVRDAKKSHHKQMVNIHRILLLIMMGDVVGALRAYAQTMDRDFRKFSRDIIQKLGQVRRARAMTITRFAHNRPPKAYAGEDPNSVARANNQSSNYNQFIQLNTQLMGELRTSEQNLTEYLATMKRDLDAMWQAYSSMRDADFRVTERLVSVR